MPTLQCEALLLRAVDFGESDRIVHLLTPETGRLTAIAKGARRSVRRFPGALDLFSHLRIQVDRRRRGPMARLEYARLLSPFLALRRDPRRFALASYLAELMSRLAPESGLRAEVAPLFAFAIGALRLIERAPPSPGLRALIELRALDALGHRPQLERCVRCGSPAGATRRVRVCIPDGGVICERCAGSRPNLVEVQLGTLRALAQALDFDLESLHRLALSDSAVREATGLVERFGRFHLGFELRSERFLAQVFGADPAARSA